MTQAARLAASDPAFLLGSYTKQRRPGPEAAHADGQAAIRWVLSNLNDQNFCTLGCGAAQFYSIQDDAERDGLSRLDLARSIHALMSIDFPN
jgi:hypothetical protein